MPSDPDLSLESMLMNRVIVVIKVGLCVAFLGCASPHKTAAGHSYDDYKRALAEVATAPVPLPDRTPFDSNEEGRDTYLESYQDGYRTGLTGYYVTPDFQAGPHHRERVDGYYAGLSAGGDLWSKANLGPGAHFYGERPAKFK